MKSFQVHLPGVDRERFDNPVLFLQRIESAMNSPNERTLRDLLPSDDEMNRKMYEDVRRMSVG